MSVEYLSVVLPENVKELLETISNDRALSLIRSSEYIMDTGLAGMDPDDSDAEIIQIWDAVKESVGDLTFWPLHTVKGVSFYTMGGESYGDSPYEDFDLHLVAAEVLHLAGLD